MNVMSTQYLPQVERDILRAANRSSLLALSDIRPDEFTRGRMPRPAAKPVVGGNSSNSKPIARINPNRKAA